ncbi:MAG: hypothetical protein MK078_09450 [Crocinitomicaceae bacterium]|nr:hypothetical protein [Crocinitomicaceae bacterium]
MKSIRYATGKKVNDTWKTKEEDLYGISEYYFNEVGNIDSILGQRVFPDLVDHWTLIFTYNDILKETSVHVEDTSVSVYTWSGDKHYSTKTPIAENKYSIATTSMDEYYREYLGTYEIIEDNQTIYYETYYNFFDENGNVSKTRTVDHTNNQIRTMLYEDRIFDKKGNSIQFTLIDSASGEVKNVTKREFTYYE